MALFKRTAENPFTQMSKVLGEWPVNHIINVSARDRYVWFKNPKVASSTLNRTLQHFQMRGLKTDPDEKAHHPPHHSAHLKAYQFAPEEFNALLTNSDYFRFAFVRNPYSRLVSAYADKILRNRPQKQKILKQMGQTNAPIETDISFPEFVEAVSSTPTKKLDIHWTHQTVMTGQRWFDLDFTGKLENFTADFQQICKQIDPKLKKFLKKNNSHQTGSTENWQAYYSDPTIKALVLQTYAEDFETFGYSTQL